MSEPTAVRTPSGRSARWIRRWWPVLLLGWATIGSYGVAFYSFGVLIEAIHLDKGWPRGAIASAYSISVAGGAVASPLAGAALDRVGGRPVLIAATVAGGALLLAASYAERLPVFAGAWGLGAGAVSAGAFYSVTMPLTARHYPTDRAAAFALLTLVGGLSSPIYLPLVGAIVDEWGWRVCLRVLVLSLPITVLPAAAFAAKGGSAGQEERGGEGEEVEPGGYASVTEAYRSRPTIQLLAMLLASGAAYSALLVHQVSAMTAVGLSLSAAATATAIRGFLSLPGRALLAVAVGRLGVGGSLLGVHLLMLSGTAALALTGPLWLLGSYILLSGLAYGMQAPLSNLYAIDVYGERRMGTLLGVQRLIVGVGSASGPVLLGLVADATGGYRVGLIGVMGLAAVAIALMLTMPPSAPPATQASPAVRR